MSLSLNRAQLIGHLGRDPDIRHTQDGRPIANFSLATSERWTDKQSGEKKERTEWHNVVVFSEPLVKVIEQHAKKGSKIFVEGALSTRKWTDQEGRERYTTEIVLRQFNGTLILLGSNRAAPDENSYGTTKTVQQQSAKDSLDDEIPF